jgi:transcriptional regulator of acetoin/glycerol metabolism
MTALVVHRWPGNVRELKNVIERAAILSANSPVVLPEHLMIQRRTTRDAVAGAPAAEIVIPSTGRLLEDIEREAVALTLKLTNGNQTAAARILGISRPTLAKKMGRPAPSQIRSRA